MGILVRARLHNGWCWDAGELGGCFAHISLLSLPPVESLLHRRALNNISELLSAGDKQRHTNGIGRNTKKAFISSLHEALTVTSQGKKEIMHQHCEHKDNLKGMLRNFMSGKYRTSANRREFSNKLRQQSRRNKPVFFVVTVPLGIPEEILTG